ncbi:MAG: TadE/TadG family type IV pilus assembly protein [Vicinamibacterales bacterium]
MRRLWLRSAHGAELIEFIIVFPILMLLLAGIFDFGMLLRNYEVVTNAAREGARVAILDGYAAADVDARVNQYLQSAGLAGSHSVAVATVPITTGAGTMTARSVTLNYFYQFVTLSGIAPFFGGSFGSLPLRAVSVMRTETQIAP